MIIRALAMYSTYRPMFHFSEEVSSRNSVFIRRSLRIGGMFRMAYVVSLSEIFILQYFCAVANSKLLNSIILHRDESCHRRIDGITYPKWPCLCTDDCGSITRHVLYTAQLYVLPN
jgi:hypothetical protein